MRLDGAYQLEFRPSERRRRQCWLSAAINIAPLRGESRCFCARAALKMIFHTSGVPEIEKRRSEKWTGASFSQHSA